MSQESDGSQRREPDRPKRRGPLREFKHGGAPLKKVSRRKRRFKATVFWLAPFIAILLLTVAGAYSVLQFYGGEEVAVENAERSASSGFSDEIKVPELLDAHLDALGGRQALMEVRSVRYEGEVTFSSAQSDFQMLVLKPDKGMLITNPGEAGGQKLVLNGDIAWRILEQPDGTREVLRLEDENVESLKWSLRVHNTLRSLALQGRHSGLSVKEIEFMDKPCYEVTKKGQDGLGFSAILEKETLYLLKIEEILNGRNANQKFTIIYEDYRMVSGVVEPYKTTLYRDGVLDNEVEIRSIQINSGVISSLFRVPDELRN